MPCRDSFSGQLKEKQERLDKFVQMMCEQCKRLENMDNYAYYFTPELSAWWEKHKLEDEKRRRTAEKQRLNEEKMEREKANDEYSTKVAMFERLKKELGY